MNLCHDNLANYYKMNFALMQYHNYALSDIESMIPFEREVYIGMLIQYIQEENDRIKARNNQ